MGEPLRVNRSVTIPDRELRWRFSRSSGPGGQGVNTADSRVELSFDVASSRVFGPTLRSRALDRLSHRLVGGVLTIVVSDERSQLRNRELARQRLAATMADALRPPPRTRRPTRPSKASVDRRIASKKRRGQVKRQRQSTDD
jgi:ribosome-associated protein